MTKEKDIERFSQAILEGMKSADPSRVDMNKVINHLNKTKNPVERVEITKDEVMTSEEKLSVEGAALTVTNEILEVIIELKNKRILTLTTALREATKALEFYADKNNGTEE